MVTGTSRSRLFSARCTPSASMGDHGYQPRIRMMRARHEDPWGPVGPSKWSSIPYGSPKAPMGSHGKPCEPMGPHGANGVRFPMVLHRSPWFAMGTYGGPRWPKGSPWGPMESHGAPWGPMVLMGNRASGRFQTHIQPFAASGPAKCIPGRPRCVGRVPRVRKTVFWGGPGPGPPDL